MTRRYSWLCDLRLWFFAFQMCLMKLTLPHVRETSVAFLRCLELPQLIRMLLGIGVTEVCTSWKWLQGASPLAKEDPCPGSF